ncbi:hypothetical protein ABVT39_016408 [Epinephelus coioides]
MTTTNLLASNTLARRRHDVVTLQLSIKEIKERWPALFDVSQISAEFQRLTYVNLEPKFMAMLDKFTPKLLSIFKVKKGAAGERHCAKLDTLLQTGVTIQHTREVVIRCLIDHLGEKESSLIKEFKLQTWTGQILKTTRVTLLQVTFTNSLQNHQSHQTVLLLQDLMISYGADSEEDPLQQSKSYSAPEGPDGMLIFSLGEFFEILWKITCGFEIQPDERDGEPPMNLISALTQGVGSRSPIIRSSPSILLSPTLKRHTPMW